MASTPETHATTTAVHTHMYERFVETSRDISVFLHDDSSHWLPLQQPLQWTDGDGPDDILIAQQVKDVRRAIDADVDRIRLPLMTIPLRRSKTLRKILPVPEEFHSRGDREFRAYSLMKVSVACS